MTVRCALLVLLLAAAACGCERGGGSKIPTGRLVFQDDFDRTELGPRWRATGSGYEIANGSLRAQGAHNHPLWLTEALPREARVDFTARASDKDVDIKVELFGDGRSHATEASYTATSYVLILGGWRNTKSIIARMDEHGANRIARSEPRGKPGHNYRFSAVRQGKSLRWFLDGELFLEMTDDDPLEGPDHSYFAFNNWASEVTFDNLKIYDLREAGGS